MSDPPGHLRLNSKVMKYMMHKENKRGIEANVGKPMPFTIPNTTILIENLIELLT